MRRKIKFPLIMKDGVEVRNIDELRENFDLEKVISYYLEGKLQRWLQDRNYEEELNKIKELNTSSDKFSENLCISLDVEYKKDKLLDIESIEHTNDKVTKLRDYLEDEKINEIIDYVAFNQEDLIKLVKNKVKDIYLYNGQYEVDLCEKNKKYTGLGNVIVLIRESGKIDLDKNNVVLENLKLKSENIVTIVSEKSKDLKIMKNIVHKINDYENYEVIIDEILVSKEDILFNKIRDAYLGRYLCYKTRTIKGHDYAVFDGLYRVDKNTSKKELIVDDVKECRVEEIEAYCTYRDKVFYVKSTGYNKSSIFKVNIDGSEKKELITKTSFHKWILEDGCIDKTFISANNEYIIWRAEDGIYRCKHDGSEKEVLLLLLNDGYTRIHSVTNKYLIYTVNHSTRSQGYMYRLNLNNKESINLDNNVKLFIRYDNSIFYVKWDRTGYGQYSNDPALVIYELDIESGRKQKLIDFYPHCSVTKLECDGENLYYYTKSHYGDRNEDKKKIKLEGKEIEYIQNHGNTSLEKYEVTNREEKSALTSVVEAFFNNKRGR